TDRPRPIGSIEDRWCGFRSVFRNACLLHHPFIGSVRRLLPDEMVEIQAETFSELCLQALRGALEPLDSFPFDCVFAQYDHFALAMIHLLKAHGFRVPQDVGVVGFDDHDFTEYTEPPLTTIRQPLREIGMQAARRLLRRLEEPDLPAAALRLPPRLVARRSSDRLAAMEQP
ncbi:MAG: substrate-binding domain-containing protein, partial [Fimbriimonadales bacterium]